MQHSIIVQLIGDKLHLAPLDENKLHNVLDLATGTGIWAIEFAKKYPFAHITGTDLSPVSHQGAPKNCKFIMEDAEDDWSFTEPFSYIHVRVVFSCFEDPLSIFRKAYDALEPGGILELQDWEMPMGFANEPQPDSSTSAFVRWGGVTIEAAIKRGRPLNNVQHYARWLREIGFEDVEEKKFVLPIGPWNNEDPLQEKLGTWQLLNMINAMEGFTLRNLSAIGWTPEQCQALVNECKDEMESRKLKPWNYIVVVWGRKPL
ncbi:hypothetical protein AAFC00_004791 [Neodothiora populina]|uniref:S-adenosyl-L-methionine-dependent methyltransferase n=1 Tax=Neodothiora populina TaxID=2781224 RepID=A0ABR3P362_9PEZI